MNTQEKLNTFISRAQEMDTAHKRQFDLNPSYGNMTISDEMFYKWKGELRIFTQRNLVNHELYNDILEFCNDEKKWVTSLDNIIGKLQSVAADDEFFDRSNYAIAGNSDILNKNDVFIVHGHTDKIDSVKLVITKLGLNPIVLREQPNKGRTIISKFEDYGSQAGYAIIIYSPDDEMKDGGKRARQNVVIEHGYFIGKLGRERVFVLIESGVDEPGVEQPGDIDGVVYVPMDGNWKYELVKELKAVGYNVTADSL